MGRDGGVVADLFTLVLAEWAVECRLTKKWIKWVGPAQPVAKEANWPDASTHNRNGN